MEVCQRNALPNRIRLKFLIMSKSKGLGDSIEKITKATGIKAIVDAASKATGKDCGCKARKEALNKAVPYKK